MPPVDQNAPVLMSLAGLAYASPGYIADHVAGHAVGGVQWEMEWIADTVDAPVNFAYLVRDPATDRFALAIRGTYPDPLSSAYWDDANQDSPFGPMQAWPYAGDSGAMVSGGTWAGFNGVLDLTGAGRRLSDVLTSLRGAELLVTGHSLGGTLAPVVALWTGTVNPVPISVYAFAGMTPGNDAFAALFGPQSRLAGRVWRYNNRLDTVPYGWNRVLDTLTFYLPQPRGGLLVEALLLGMAARLAPYGYASVGEEVVLDGVVQPPTFDCELVAYVLENLHQHMPDTYLQLLGAPPLSFTIGFGAVVDEAPVATRALRHGPVFVASKGTAEG